MMVMESQTIFFLVKAVVSGLLIATISSLAKVFPKWAALLTALPLVTYLSLIWIYAENKDLGILEVYTRDVLIWLVPSLFFFIAAIFLFRAKVPFMFTMILSTAVLALGVFVFNRLGLLK